MANCIVCSTELKFMNTPTFGSGKLSDGGVVCSTCFKKINNINPKVAFKLKNHSLNDIKELLQEKLADDEQKNSRLDEIKKQIQAIKLSNTSSFWVDEK